jgi:hypothetical protein
MVVIGAFALAAAMRLCLKVVMKTDTSCPQCTMWEDRNLDLVWGLVWFPMRA